MNTAGSLAPKAACNIEEVHKLQPPWLAIEMNAGVSGLDDQKKLTRFQGWEVRVAERVLVVRGQTTSIGSRAFDVLVALVSRPGRVVPKEELIDAAWPGRIVEENNLSVQIAALRKAIGTGAIRTVAGVGYCLSAIPLLEAKSDDKNRRHTVEFLGREADIEWLTDRLRLTALVTIVGTGGVGKTSLAREVLARREAWSTKRAIWIDLAPLRDAHQFVSALAKALEIELGGVNDPTDGLLAGLGQVEGVIALDNCEHLLEGVATFVRRALEKASGISWLATSQEPLHLQGEAVYRLGPLEVPDLDVSLGQAMDYSAVALLCQRAAAADRHFQLDEARLPIAIKLCRQLDGLPLAIEMAATRVATFGLEGVYANLHNRLQLLVSRSGVPPRQPSLRSTFDWSHELLSSLEKKVFRRLEPFLDGFSVDMALRAICDEGREATDVEGVNEWRALEALDALANKSLIHRRLQRGNRLFLFESARDYARVRLAEAGETELARQRHGFAVAQWFDDALSNAGLMNDESWIGRYAIERANVRAALAWACEAREPELLARLVAALAAIDSLMHGQAEVLAFNLPLEVLEKAPARSRAHAHLELGWAHYTYGNRELGTSLARKALDDFLELADMGNTYRALAILTRLYESRPGLRPLALETWESFQRIDDRKLPLRTRLFCAILAGLQYEGTHGLDSYKELERIAAGAGFNALGAVCRAHLTNTLLIRGDFQEAADASQRFLLHELPPRAKVAILHNQVLALIRLGRVHDAYEPARSSLRISPNTAHLVTDAFALAAAMKGKMVDAALLYGYGVKARQDRDKWPDPAEAKAISETIALIRGALAEDRVATLTGMGAAMSSPEALAIALMTQ